MSAVRILRVVALMVGLIAPAVGRAEFYVAGDSIGMGVGMASQLPSVAAISIAIRGPKIIEQLRAVPVGSTVFLSLGTNDAAGNLVKGGPDLERLLAFAQERRLKIYWVGPPCVLKPWDETAKKLDESLRADLARSGVTYVSMRAAVLCDPAVRAKDGVHFTMTGYRMMWQIAAEAANYKPVIKPVPTQVAPVQIAPAYHVGVRPAPHHATTAKKKRKKSHRPVHPPTHSSGAAQ